MTAGDGFSVDVQALREVSEQLTSIVDEVAAHPARDLDCPPAAFGHSRLANATSGFSERLQRGIEALTKDGVEVAGRLNQTAESYRHGDDEARSLLERAADPLIEWDGPNA